jgi:hypothetical protein
MDPVQAPPPHQIRCDACSQTTPSYDIVLYGSMEQGCRQFCSRCFHTEGAQLAGLQGFEDAKFEAVGLADCTGELHEFHFRSHLFGTGIALDAFELGDGSPAGYQFQIIGDPKDDLMVLLGRLIEKMRRACRANISRTTNMDRKSRIQEWCVAGLSATTIAVVASHFS